MQSNWAFHNKHVVLNILWHSKEHITPTSNFCAKFSELISYFMRGEDNIMFKSQFECIYFMQVALHSALSFSDFYLTQYEPYFSFASSYLKGDFIEICCYWFDLLSLNWQFYGWYCAKYITKKLNVSQVTPINQDFCIIMLRLNGCSTVCVGNKWPKSGKIIYRALGCTLVQRDCIQCIQL